MTQYLLSLPHDTEESPTMETMDPDELQAEGALVFAGGLYPPNTATTVDNTGDAPVMTDGPFVEAKEYLGGFWVIDVPDRDTALAWARDASKSLGGRIEVRAFQEAPE